MEVIADNNEILDSTVSYSEVKGVKGLIFESRGGRKDSLSNRNFDYLIALGLVLKRLQSKKVKTINVFLVSKASSIVNMNDRIIEVDGKSRIEIDQYENTELRKKITKAVSEKKQNPNSKGGNPTKRILINADLLESEWESIVNNSIGYTIGNEMYDGEIAFDPKNIKDGREKILVSINRRKGQKKFRSKLIKAYNKKCAITGCDFEPILQGAHIFPYRGEETNHITNGILLRSDIHDLFDLHFIGISDDYLILVSDDLKGTEYEEYHMKKINLPDKVSDFPSKKALKLRPLPYKKK